MKIKPILNCYGFTLIELLTTMTILGILLMLAVPTYNNYLTEKRLDSAAMQIASDIRHVQQLAVATENYNYQVKFNQNSGHYQTMLGLKVLSRIFLPDGVSIYDVYFNNDYQNKHILCIDAKGIPHPIGGHVILFAGEKMKYVIVASITGRVRISDKP